MCVPTSRVGALLVDSVVETTITDNKDNDENGNVFFWARGLNMTMFQLDAK